MGLALVVIILVAIATGFAAFAAGKADSSLTMSFALVLAIAGGAVYIGAEGELDMLGLGLLLVAIFSAGAALLSSTRTARQEQTPR